MATYLLNISSADREIGQNTDDFSVSFSPPLRVAGNWSMAFHSGTCWYSWYNIAIDYNNQTFRYYNGSVWKNIVITPGLYGIEDINRYVQASMLANGDVTVVGSTTNYHITLTPDYNTFKLLITIDNGYQVDLSVGNIYQIFGFNPVIVTSTQQGPNNVNITNGIDKVLIHVDCITGSYVGGAASDVLYSFSANTAPSSLIELNPSRLLFLPINQSGFLQRIRVRVTDQSNRRINLNGEDISLSLYLKQIN